MIEMGAGRRPSSWPWWRRWSRPNQALLIFCRRGRVFIVRRISVQGNQLFTDRAIADQSGIDLGQSIFSVDQDAIYSAFAGNGDIVDFGGRG